MSKQNSKSWAAIYLTLLMLISTSATAVETTVPSESTTFPPKFIYYAKSIKLAGPGLIVIDPSTSTTLFDEASEVPRAPASVFKLVSTFAALKYVGPDFQFKTKIFTTSSKNTYLLDGDLDPWLTSDIKLAKKNGQKYLPILISKANKVNAKSILNIPEYLLEI
ncbi:MAG: D-alanyl-D-alanine carboxypeptidase [Actinobacteria bacterium]|nr:D-alanyl-D-alanine carboxypeptidase [Actinomycetota bacterium]